MKRIKRKNGFSLAEVVVALAIVAIVSVGALSIVSSSINSRVNAINRTQAQIFASNLIECFKASEDNEKFIEYAGEAVGINLEYDYNKGYYTYISNKNAFK